MVEDESRQTEMQQQAELFAQRQRELDRQTARDRAEEARRDSAVFKGKLFGDAMRASAIRMGVDPIEAIPFFRNVEQLFGVYERYSPPVLLKLQSGPKSDEIWHIFRPRLQTFYSHARTRQNIVILKKTC